MNLKWMYIENGYGVHHDSLRNWIKKYKSSEALAEAKTSESVYVEIKRLQKELKRVTEEGDILKKAAAYFVSQPN